MDLQSLNVIAKQPLTHMILAILLAIVGWTIGYFIALWQANRFFVNQQKIEALNTMIEHLSDITIKALCNLEDFIHMNENVKEGYEFDKAELLELQDVCKSVLKSIDNSMLAFLKRQIILEKFAARFKCLVDENEEFKKLCGSYIKCYGDIRRQKNDEGKSPAEKEESELVELSKRLINQTSKMIKEYLNLSKELQESFYKSLWRKIKD